MYTKFSGGHLTLWCDGKLDEAGKKRKRDDVDPKTKRQEKEEDVDSIFKDLKRRHDSKFDTPKLRLWARMICSKLHDDYDKPPDIPAFSGVVPKRPRRESLGDALSDVAVASIPGRVFAFITVRRTTGPGTSCLRMRQSFVRF